MANRIKCHTKIQTMFVHVSYILELSNAIQYMCIFSPYYYINKPLVEVSFLYIGL